MIVAFFNHAILVSLFSSKFVVIFLATWDFLLVIYKTILNINGQYISLLIKLIIKYFQIHNF